MLLDTSVDDGTGLGPAIVWALRNGANELDLVADVPLTVAARRAGEFALPIRVWALEGRDLRSIEAASPSEPPAADPAHLAFVPDIEAAGAAVVIEHGVVTGEVRGLEVCRVVDVAAATNAPVACGSRSASVRTIAKRSPRSTVTYPPAKRWRVSWRR